MRSYCQIHISEFAPDGECRDCDIQKENDSAWQDIATEWMLRATGAEAERDLYSDGILRLAILALGTQPPAPATVALLPAVEHAIRRMLDVVDQSRLYSGATIAWRLRDAISFLDDIGASVGPESDKNV